MSEATQPKPIDAIASFYSPVCPHCGKKKQPRWSFCGPDYHRLPKLMREALYRGIGSGYVPAFQAASDWLKEDDARKADKAKNGSKAARSA
ncbi:MAG TPA: hypothetical protein VKY85_07785 [Candidatus Angelobacter sp.]|nr:hypothetical protein [Candidatus Angelobacter sp.]